MKIFNTHSGTKEDFIPLNPNHIKIYACGPTVYNYAHIGNARMAVVFDTLVRVLRDSYPKVTYVSNITDIDDKIIDAANELKVPIEEITQKYTNIYNDDMSKLLVKAPDMQPKATEYIPEMITLIEDLIKNDKIKITKLAQGLPVGGEIEQLDDGTLFSAFKNRVPVTDN